MYQNIREEELKNKVASDYFAGFDATKIVGNIDFCVTLQPNNPKPGDPKQIELFETQSLLWAEAKRGQADIFKSITQLILTIGKARTFDKALPPAFLGAFDAFKIAFIPYSSIQEIFYQNDFNWNVTPSNYATKEFVQIHEQVKKTIENESLLFEFESDTADLNTFIKQNFVSGKSELSKIKIDKNNFLVIYNKWLQVVKPSIILNWNAAKKSGIIDGDFYLADLLSSKNQSLKDSLYVLLKSDHYEIGKKINDLGMFTAQTTNFYDDQKAHTQFWNKYQRPPKAEYEEYIISRRDLLVPQDVRERKGSFFTPQIWVELSQKYLTDTLGENWQDDYYIWDCAAGTGNLLAGLTNKYHIWASTLDTQDVDVMRDRIKNGANLLESHCFQFDFLNDDFSKLPPELQNIINDPEKRKKLVMYINPPYAETATNKTSEIDRINKRGVSFTKTQEKYSDLIGIATKELFAQFFIRIYFEISGCYLASFSTMKYTQGPNFVKFRNCFLADFKKGFTVPADTFDNVKGKFPIGFLIWKLSGKSSAKEQVCDVFDNYGLILKNKTFFSYDKNKFITDWFIPFHTRLKIDKNIAAIGLYGSDFQHSNFIRITNSEDHPNRWTYITEDNLCISCIYLSVRHVFEATWLNDRDQFLYPNDGWKADTEFQNDCLAYALFHGQNRITANQGANHWIPFREQEIEARDGFASHFMTDFMLGKLAKVDSTADQSASDDPNAALFAEVKTSFVPHKPLVFSAEAQAVFEAGRRLWRYYHTVCGRQNGVSNVGLDMKATSTLREYNPNASLYDIREYFQGRNAAGKMNNKSLDLEYTQLIGALRAAVKVLGQKIQPKVYEFGFLRE